MEKMSTMKLLEATAALQQSPSFRKCCQYQIHQGRSAKGRLSWSALCTASVLSWAQSKETVKEQVGPGIAALSRAPRVSFCSAGNVIKVSKTKWIGG